MPSWTMHLAIAKKVNDKLKLNKDLFYLGNLIPDIDYGNKFSRNETHYKINNPFKPYPIQQLPNIELFINDYKNKITNPLILGYLTHLLTDLYFNNYVFSNSWVIEKNKLIGIKLKNGIVKKTSIKKIKDIKKYDFINYGKYLLKNNYIDLPEYNKNMIKSLKLLKDNFYTLDDAKKRIYYLNTKYYDYNKLTLKERLFGMKYKLFTKDKYDNLFEECIEFIFETYQKFNIK